MARDSNDDDDENLNGPKSNATKDRISTALKQVYNGVADEPMPEKLTDLLEQLKSGKTP